MRTEALHSPICHQSETQEREVNPKIKHFAELHKNKTLPKKKKEKSVTKNPKWLFFNLLVRQWRRKDALDAAGGLFAESIWRCVFTRTCLSACACVRDNECVFVSLRRVGGLRCKWKEWRSGRGGLLKKGRKSGDKRQHVDHREDFGPGYCVTSHQDKLEILTSLA